MLRSPSSRPPPPLRCARAGIKVALPTECATGTCFLELYCKYIGAIQARYGGGRTLPFAIMTSDDTHARTLALLESHAYFGLTKEQARVRRCAGEVGGAERRGEGGGKVGGAGAALSAHPSAPSPAPHPPPISPSLHPHQPFLHPQHQPNPPKPSPSLPSLPKPSPKTLPQNR